MVIAYLIVALIAGTLAGGMSMGAGMSLWSSFLIGYLAAVGAFAVAAGVVLVRRSARDARGAYRSSAQGDAGYRAYGPGAAGSASR